YEAWLAVPVLLGLVAARRGARSFRLPAVLTLVIVGLTQVLYPWFYDSLVFAQPWMVALVSVRNILLVGLLAVATIDIWRAAPRFSSAHESVAADPVDGARMDA
ncbi:MAG: hypothetical protein JWP75_2942, partial [Frondihabitans sp.]|nr:hypothetical protein [Frondihabitans sp.]